MPWGIEQRGDQFCVVVKSGPKKGQAAGCHSSKEKAVRQLAAINANTSEGLSAVTRLLVKLVR